MKNLLFSLAIICTTSLAFAQEDNSFNLDESYSLGENGTIYLKADDAKVTITGEDRKDVAVKIDYQWLNPQG